MEANVRVKSTLSGRKIPPLKEVFVSPPFLALMATHIGYNWGIYVLLSGTPLFLNNIHHYSITSVSESTIIVGEFQTIILCFLSSEWIHLNSSLLGHVPHVISSGKCVRLPAKHRPPLYDSHQKTIQLNRHNWTWTVHDWPRLRGLQQHFNYRYIGFINGNECRWLRWL